MENLRGPIRKEAEKILVTQGKLEAIKYLQQQLRMDLKTSKTAVELLEKELNPHTYSHLDRKPPKTPKLHAGIFVPGVFMLVGLGLLIATFFIHLSNNAYIENGVMMEGTVIDLISSYDNRTMKAPVILYGWEGEEYEYFSNSYQNPPAYEIGESVILFLKPENPEDILIDTFTGRWLLIVILGGIGFVFFVIGLLTFIKLRG